MSLLDPEEMAQLGDGFFSALVKLAAPALTGKVPSALGNVVKRVKELYTGSRLNELEAVGKARYKRINQAHLALNLSDYRNIPDAHAARRHLYRKQDEMLRTVQKEHDKVNAVRHGTAAVVGGTALHGLNKHLKHKHEQKSKEAGFAPEVKLAFARALLEEGAVTTAQAAALSKYAAVSPEQARRSLDRLDTLEQNKPTVRQLGRYGAIGGIGGAAIGAIGHTIEGNGPLKGATPKAKMLNLAANTVKGALGGGAIPLVRSGMDRRAEQGTLRKFMRETPGESNA